MHPPNPPEPQAVRLNGIVPVQRPKNPAPLPKASSQPRPAQSRRPTLRAAHWVLRGRPPCTPLALRTPAHDPNRGHQKRRPPRQRIARPHRLRTLGTPSDQIKTARPPCGQALAPVPHEPRSTRQSSTRNEPSSSPPPYQSQRAATSRIHHRPRPF